MRKTKSEGSQLRHLLVPLSAAYTALAVYGVVLCQGSAHQFGLDLAIFLSFWVVAGVLALTTGRQPALRVLSAKRIGTPWKG